MCAYKHTFVYMVYVCSQSMTVFNPLFNMFDYLLINMQFGVTPSLHVATLSARLDQKWRQDDN